MRKGSPAGRAMQRGESRCDEIFQITNEQTGAAVESPVTRVLREGVIVGLANHTVLTAKDGTHRPIEDSAAPIKNGGSIQGVVLVFRDASEAASTETRIRESEERYRSLVAATTQTVWIASPDFSSSVTITGQDPIGLPDRCKDGRRMARRDPPRGPRANETDVC